MNNPIKKNMHLMVVALLDESYLENIILGLTSIGGGYITMLDAFSGTQNLSYSIPMFAEFIGSEGKRFCKVLLTGVSEPEPAARLLDVLLEGGLDFIGLGIGEIYSIPLNESVVIDDLDI